MPPKSPTLWRDTDDDRDAERVAVFSAYLAAIRAEDWVRAGELHKALVRLGISMVVRTVTQRWARGGQR